MITREQYKKLVDEAANPDTGTAALLQLRDFGDEFFDHSESLAQKAQELEGSVKSLRETNMALFLKTGGSTANKEDEPEETPEDEYKRLFADRVFEKEDE